MISTFDWIDCGGSIGRILRLYKGWRSGHVTSRFLANPVEIANKSIEKRGIIIDSAHAWTVHAATAGHPDCGPFGPKGRQSAWSVLVLNICPMPFGGG
jgi:hypothetical protein